MFACVINFDDNTTCFSFVSAKIKIIADTAQKMKFSTISSFSVQWEDLGSGQTYVMEIFFARKKSFF